MTSTEGFALLAAGRAAMALPGADPSGPLGRALDKLAETLGEAPVVVDLEPPPYTNAVAAAATTAERLRITYWTPSRDEATERTITPRAVFNDRGHWYVLADDHRSEAERSFRIDRILEMTATGEHDAMRDVDIPDTDRWFADMADIDRVVLRFPTEVAWVIEQYPADAVETIGDGRTQAEMPVASEQWLARLLLRLGPDAEVLAPERWRTLGAVTASRVLAAYDEVTPDS